MSQHRLATPDIDRIFRGETVSGLSEWQLLERYLERRDEIAFEALVARHGPMVLSVCRRMLAEQSDVDDAFQATFLVLVRRARQLGPRDAIGPWLHGVAARVSLRARSEAARRRRLLPIADEIPAAAGAEAVVDRELGEVLDHELSRLPSKYRSPIVLCYLEGRTHEEAAAPARVAGRHRQGAAFASPRAAAVQARPPRPRAHGHRPHPGPRPRLEARASSASCSIAPSSPHCNSQWAMPPLKSSPPRSCLLWKEF